MFFGLETAKTSIKREQAVESSRRKRACRFIWSLGSTRVQISIERFRLFLLTMKDLIVPIVGTFCFLMVIWAFLEEMGIFRDTEPEPINYIQKWDGSFTGSGNNYTCVKDCDCKIKRSELEAGCLIRCSCGHITTWHHD